MRVFQDADHSLCRVERSGNVTSNGRRKDQLKDAGPDFAADYLKTMTDWLSTRFLAR